MNEKIQHIIQDIRRKKDALNASFNQQVLKASQLEREIEQLKSELSSKDNRISDLKEESVRLTNEKAQLVHDNSELKSLLEETKNQVINAVKTDNSNSQEQIDELVREIEYCIGQLKNNA